VACLGTKEKLWQFRTWRFAAGDGHQPLVARLHSSRLDSAHQVIYMAFQFSVLASANSVGQHSLPFTGNGQTVRIIAANLDQRKIQQANQFGFVIAMG